MNPSMQTPEFDFKRDVVDLSFEKPVLIDFWAPWCGPCKVLGPVLEELENEDGGRWKLVKLNTEIEQEIAAYFRIQSIPHCKLVFEGKIVDEFTGALSKTQVRKWLDDVFSKLGIPEEIEAQSDDFDELIAGQPAFPDRAMAEKLSLFLTGHPDHEEARMLWAKHAVFFEPEATLSMLNEYQDQKKFAELIEDLHVISEWLAMQKNEKDAAASVLEQARSKWMEHEQAQALELIIESVHRYPQFQSQLPRRVGISLFHLLGNQHPLTAEYRKLFDMAIY